jgi:NADPH:quinone reductase
MAYAAAMRRVVCNQIGSLDDLVVEDVPAPEPGPGQVLVIVKASGVNYVDALFVTGGYQIKPPTPFTPGSEFAGVVAGTDRRVLSSMGLGAFAEEVAVAEAGLLDLPDEIGFEVGASIMQSYATAVFSLEHRTKLAAGEWVLVLGAGGGVGRACVDLARSLGAHVIGVASSEEKRAAATDAGAAATIDPGTEDVKVRAREISGGGVDVVVDPIGGALAEPSLRALRTFGRYLVIGFAAGEIPRLPLNQVLLNNRTIIGVDWGAWAMRNAADNADLLRGVLDAVAKGELRPAEPSVAPLDKAADVLRDLVERRVVGKVVLVP